MILPTRLTAGFGLAMLVILMFHALPARSETLTARGVVVARNEATLSVSVSALVRRLPFRRGEAFRRGDTLAAFDCKGLKAEFAALQAVYEGRRVKLAGDKRLKKYQAIGASELAISKSAMDEARARRDAQAALVEQCIIKAPYDGRVVFRKVHENERPQAGQPLLKIVDTAAADVDMIVPSKWLRWLKRDTRFSFVVDETGERLAGHVRRIGATIDAISQTVRIVGNFDVPTAAVLPGMSGTATFTYPGS